MSEQESPKTPSVCPKIRTNTKKKETTHYEPLENKKVAFIDYNGEKISISWMSKEFCPKFNCIHYYELPFDEFQSFNKIAINTWILNCKKFETFLSSIVNLPYFRFWSLVVYNKDVHSAIESYFNSAIRPYRIPLFFKNPDFRQILSNIHLMVFQFYIRILLNKESPKNYIDENYHSELLINNKILDITKIMDLIQLYGFGPNSDILNHLLKNFITKNYSQFNKDIEFLLKEIRRFFIQYKTGHSYDINNELVYIIANVSDVLFTLNKLVQFVPQIAFICHEIKLIESMIDFYTIYFPHMENETQLLIQNNHIVKNFYDYLKSQICLSKASALLFFHRMVHNFFIDQFVALQMNQEILDILTNLFNYLIPKNRFCLDYFSKFPLEAQFSAVKERYDNGTDKNEILELYKKSLKPLLDNYSANKNKNLSETNFNGCDNSEYHLVQNQQQKLPKSTINFENYFKKDPEIISKESFILDMFPDLGDGFIYKCLEHYNFNTEQVLDSILECKLPPEIEQLDRKLTKSNLIQLMELKEKEYYEKYLNDEKKYNPHINTDCQLTDIHIGKKDKIRQVQKEKKNIISKTIELAEKINEEEEEMKDHVRTLIERGKLTFEQLKTSDEFMGIDIYNDEFDDTYGFENRFSIDNINETTENDDSDEYDNTLNTDEQTSNDLKAIEQQHPSSSSTGGKFRTNEKYENCAKYFRKQLYNKRNYGRQQSNRNNNSNGQSKTSIVNQSNPIADNKSKARMDSNEHYRNSNKHSNVSKDANNNNNNKKGGYNINNSAQKRNSNKRK